MPRPNVLLLACLVAVAIAPVSCSNSTKPTVVVPKNGSDFLYTANSAGSPATVSAFTADRTSGKLTSVAGSPFSAGSGSMALATDPSGSFLYVANYFSSDISAYTISAQNGSLTPIGASTVPAELGVDSLAVDPGGKYLYAVTGRSENLWAYSVAPTGAISAVSGFPVAIAPVGTSSDSVIIDPSGAYLYVTNRDSSSADIYGFSRDASSGALTALPGFPVPLDGLANKAAFDPTGKFLLVTGTGVFGTLGGVAVFSLDASTGALTKVSSAQQVGTDPSGVAVDASGKFVYIPNTGDATISSFTLDASGGLSPMPGSPVASGGNGTINGPLGITTDASGHFVYVGNASNDVSVFSINQSDGTLTAVAGSPFPAGGNSPSAVVFVKNTHASR